MASRFTRFLGSIRLAVPLLVAIATILIWATVYESNVGSATVQREIYKSAWFGALVFLLAVNLGVSTLSRYPWRGPRKIGFALTHWGLILLIAGAAAVIHLSSEGMLLLRTDGGPNNQIRVEGEQLQVAAPGQATRAADVVIRPDGSVSPQHFAGLFLQGYSDQAVTTVGFQPGGNVDNLAIQLTMGSDRMGQTLRRWLAMAPGDYRQLDIGPAHLELVQAEDEAELARLLDLTDAKAPNLLRVVAAPDQRLFYGAHGAQGTTVGEWRPGEVIAPGWADIQISLSDRIDRARVQRRVVPLTAGAAAPGESFPALQVSRQDGSTLWLPWGEPVSWQGQDGLQVAAFGPKLLQLPFYVTLDDFIVARNEGSESVAMWTSQITLWDPHTDTAVQRSVWMNHPTWFRGWKLAQASWNPGDLNQSTLQLKREPWWVTALTWSGSLLVVLGIGVMFYGPAIAKRLRRRQPSPQPPAPASDDTQPDSIPETVHP
ncbi:cytochrome c biogenesis protein ResB [Halomicronema hongdechloris]|nr:cytochrome c biogenesis protein ResB [Halomicronema hongdechloris]